MDQAKGYDPSFTEVILPIRQQMYMKLVKIVNDFPKAKKWYPLLFWLDEKGYVIDILPLEMWRKEQEKKES